MPMSLELQARASSRSGGITAISKFARLALQIGMLGTGCLLVLDQELTPGSMIAASILMSRALAPVEQAISSWKMLVVARGAYQRVKQQLERSPVREGAMQMYGPRQEVLPRVMRREQPQRIRDARTDAGPESSDATSKSQHG